MTKLLEQALEAARNLTPEEQDEIARMIFGRVEANIETYQLTAEENAAIDEGLEQLERGEIASEKEARELLAKYF